MAMTAVIVMFCAIVRLLLGFEEVIEHAMQKSRTDDVKKQAHTAYDEHYFRILHSFYLDETLDGLCGDAQTEGE